MPEIKGPKALGAAVEMVEAPKALKSAQVAEAIEPLKSKDPFMDELIQETAPLKSEQALQKIIEAVLAEEMPSLASAERIQLGEQVRELLSADPNAMARWMRMRG